MDSVLCKTLKLKSTGWEDLNSFSPSLSRVSFSEGLKTVSIKLL